MSYSQPGSSRDQPMPDDDIPLKIRRVTKACDLCRKRKARCDGDPSSDRGCTLCTNAGMSCVFTRFARKRGHESSQARDLESRIIEMEGLIRLIAPGIDIEQEIEESANSDLLDNANTLLRPSDSAFLQPNDAFLRPSVDSTTAFFHPSNAILDKVDFIGPVVTSEIIPGNTTTYSPPSAGADRSSPLTGSSHPYGITTPPRTGSAPYMNNPARDRGAGPEGRPMGRSSYHTELSFTEGSEISIGLELAHAWRKEVQPQIARRNSRQVNPAEYQGSYTKPMRDKLATRVAPQDLWFPPDDLLASLVDLYFTRFNVILPLLHRPTFEAQLAQKLHWKDPSFAAVVLLVCANGSRFSDDTRVMPFYAEDIPPDMREFDAGVLFYLPWLVPATRETVVALVMNGLRLIRSDPQQGGEKQDPLLQNCMDLLHLVSRVGVHVADMANMLRELATPIKASPSL
ncbi:Fungal Zn(2)-Cys(6) binuclear cluster domain [Rhizoctonia solani]|uniref:Fungal Zn(2)-Cys(6) binuclear cluster domain n=1 Tax=Rhizoctonia solani TaxID=456999 RepID=A0A8H8SVU4_9AGAM|nr:Fungal Zn(2)-Cys(6) binuclear cluster domain [Rhizoctonia solani]QRW18822.1 Fungal Zn(2)-Cys(6) binuclear cluster domain [Rhizoctonia solani]